MCEFERVYVPVFSNEIDSKIAVETMADNIGGIVELSGIIYDAMGEVIRNINRLHELTSVLDECVTENGFRFDGFRFNTEAIQASIKEGNKFLNDIRLEASNAIDEAVHIMPCQSDAVTARVRGEYRAAWDWIVAE